MPTTELPPPFVDAAWLAGRLGEVVLADVRHALDGSEGPDTYLAGHLPGAVYVDLGADLAAPPGGGDLAAPPGGGDLAAPPGGGDGRHPMPTPEAFAAALGARGIGDDVHVVAYDTLAGTVAARLVWMLRAIGQPASLLAGGLAAWDGPLASGGVTRPPTTRRVRPWPADRLVDTDEVAVLAADPDALVVDVRVASRFRGEQEPVDPRAGHVPGARNLPLGEQLTDDGLPAGIATLRTAWDGVGLADAETVVVSCGSGVTACFGLLSLERLGVAGRLYPGSWSAWSSDPDRPVATGP